MKYIILVLFLSGCSITMPSFYDDNASKGVADLAYSIKVLNCEKRESIEQIKTIKHNYDWLVTYTSLKGSDDIGVLLDKMDPTVNQFFEKQSFSTAYCKVKKNIMTKQVNAVASAIMGRF